MGYQHAITRSGITTTRVADVGDLVIGAADGDRRSWEELVAGFTALVSSITLAHRLSQGDSDRVGTMVWRRLDHDLSKIRQPDLVGTWVAAVARDECVKVLTGHGPTAAQPAA